MRRFRLRIFPVLFVLLGLAGGANGMLLCLHESGVFHVTTSYEGDSGPVSAEPENVADGCDEGEEHTCGWCLDVELKGLELRELSDWEKETLSVPFSLMVPVGAAVFPVPDFEPAVVRFRLSPSRAESLIVAESVVLRL